MTKAEIKQKWLEELRSGKHQQGVGTLKSIEADGSFAYCCLGILEEKVLGNEIPPITRSNYNENDWFPEGDSKVYDKFREKVLNTFLVNECTGMNDEFGYSFQEIADWLEEKWSVE